MLRRRLIGDAVGVEQIENILLFRGHPEAIDAAFLACNARDAVGIAIAIEQMLRFIRIGLCDRIWNFR